MLHPHRVEPGTKVKLKDFSTDGKDFHQDRPAAEAEFRKYRDELIEWQRALYAEGRRSLLIVLQALDAGGKDGTIRHVFRGVNPQGVHVASFKEPSKRELAHDFLWRIHRDVPAQGMIGVFNRSHYEDVLIVRVDNIVPKEVWEPRFEQINRFEQLLHDTGTTILKFYLHISRDEQLERFHDRLKEPDKNWKFSPADLDKSGHWREYWKAYEDVLTRCSTPHAPWYVIPADRKWYRNYIIAKTIVETLRDMNPEFPHVEWKPEDFEFGE